MATTEEVKQIIVFLGHHYPYFKAEKPLLMTFHNALLPYEIGLIKEAAQKWVVTQTMFPYVASFIKCIQDVRISKLDYPSGDVAYGLLQKASRDFGYTRRPQFDSLNPDVVAVIWNALMVTCPRGGWREFCGSPTGWGNLKKAYIDNYQTLLSEFVEDKLHGN